MMESDKRLSQVVEQSLRAVFSTLYDRYVGLYTKSTQERYNELLELDPNLFNLFSLKDIASLLNITQTHLSRLRKNI